MPDCQELAGKLFFHAASIYWLRQGTKAPLPGSGVEASFFDLTSTSVLVRACLDTYLTLFDVFFNHSTDDEFEFKHAMWRLAGEAVREHVVPSEPSLMDSYLLAQQEIKHLRARLQATTAFQSLTPKQQRKALAGLRHADWTATAMAAGFGQKMIRQLRAFYSSHVHADGLSAGQVVGSDSATTQIEHIEMDMATTMIILSKFICLYAHHFPEARAECDRSSDIFHRAQVLAGAAALIP
jgi:hypothetical protein